MIDCKHEKTIRARVPGTGMHRWVCLKCGSSVGPTIEATWFVMIVDCERKRPLPMTDLFERVMLFDDEEHAHRIAKSNKLAARFGYEVYEWPYGGQT